MEGGERREFANNGLRGSHPPSKLVGVPGDLLGWLDRPAILVLDADDLGDVPGLQKSLDGERMAGDWSATFATRRDSPVGLPFRTTEPEAIGELASQRLPILLLLLIRELEECVIELLQVLVLLDDSRIVHPSTTCATASSAGATSTAVLALCGDGLVVPIGSSDGGKAALDAYPEVLLAHSTRLYLFGCECACLKFSNGSCCQ